MTIRNWKNGKKDTNDGQYLLHSNCCIRIRQSITYGIFHFILITFCFKYIYSATAFHHGNYLDPPFPSSATDHQSIFGVLSQQKRKLSNSTHNICSLCNHLNAPLLPDVVPSNPYFQNNYTCEILELYGMPNIPENSPDCASSRYYYTNYCCDLTSLPPPTKCKSNIRRHLLKERKYDSDAVPVERTEVPGDKSMLDVWVNLIPYITTEIDLKSSLTELYIDMSMNWVDSRLKWNVSETLCDTHITVRASMDVEKTEIWVPDYELLNRNSGLSDLPDVMALVFYDGSVYWNRNGVVSAICSITGLSRIPFDTLGCQFLFHGLTSAGEVNYKLGGTNESGFSLPVPEFHQNYVEYKMILDNIIARYFTLDKNMIEYVFYFNRAKKFYILKIVVPNILFTYLSFGLFLLDLMAGERLSYGVSVLLVLIAQDIVTSGFLPVCDEEVWISRLLNSSIYWSLFGVIESVSIIFIHFYFKSETKNDENEEEKEQLVDGLDNSCSENEERQKNDINVESEIGDKKQKVTLFCQKLISSIKTRSLSEKDKRRLISRLDSFSFYAVIVLYTFFLIHNFTQNKKFANSDKLWGE